MIVPAMVQPTVMPAMAPPEGLELPPVLTLLLVFWLPSPLLMLL